MYCDVCLNLSVNFEYHRKFYEIINNCVGLLESDEIAVVIIWIHIFLY